MLKEKVKPCTELSEKVLNEMYSVDYSPKSEYSIHLVRSFRTFSAGHPEIQCNNSGCQCSLL